MEPYTLLILCVCFLAGVILRWSVDVFFKIKREAKQAKKEYYNCLKDYNNGAFPGGKGSRFEIRKVHK